MKAIIFLTAMAFIGCMHNGHKSSLYCDDIHIATSDTGFQSFDDYYEYKIEGQVYRYKAIEGSVCKIVIID